MNAIEAKYRKLKALHEQVNVAVEDAKRHRDDIFRRLALAATPQEADAITRELKLATGDIDALIAKVKQGQLEIDQLRPQYGGVA